ncbi:MAG: hypothetical protein AAGA91_16120 [Pseudomonadota bacterium]
MSRVLLVGLLLLPGAGHALEAVGRALEPDTGRLLYVERHQCQEEGRLCAVEYSDSEGVVFLRKELDYTGGPFRPEVTLQDLRDEAVEAESHSPIEGAQVYDSGFDNFVRQSWEEMAGGEQFKFSFGFVGMNRALTMRAREITDDCAAEDLCLKVEPSSFLIGLFAQPIYLTYSRADRQLLRFQGMSNLRDDDGNSMQVDIRYDYPTGSS